MSNVISNESGVIPRVDAAPQFRALIDGSVDWFSNHWLEILIAIGAAAVIVLILHFVRGLGARLCRRDQSGSGWPTVIGRALDKTGNFFIIMAAAKLVADYAQTPDGLLSIIDFLWTIAAVFQAAIWAREIILGMIEERAASGHHRGEALASALGIIRLLVTVILFAIALVVVLDNLGVNITGLVAGLGVGGIAIGLAAQGIFSDLFAALSILFDKPFRRGDAISYDTTSGTVEAIGLKSTRIRAITGEERIISNAELLNKEIHNNTRRDHRRYKFVLGATYETDVALLRRIPDLLREIVEGEGCQFVRSGFTTFNASSLDFEVEFDSMSDSFDEGYLARHKVGVAILDRFNREGVAFAYPTQTSFTAAPDGTLVLPYPDVQPVMRVDKGAGET